MVQTILLIITLIIAIISLIIASVAISFSNSVSQKEGPRGKRGEQGPTGPIGPPGPQGEQGIPGEKGTIILEIENSGLINNMCFFAEKEPGVYAVFVDTQYLINTPGIYIPVIVSISKQDNMGIVHISQQFSWKGDLYLRYGTCNIPDLQSCLSEWKTI